MESKYTTLVIKSTINKTFVCETRMLPATTKSKHGKISKAQILTLPLPQGHMMTVKCNKPLDELIVQVWLLYGHPTFKYCTVCKRDGITDRQTDDPITRCPGAPFRPGIKNSSHNISNTKSQP